MEYYSSVQTDIKAIRPKHFDIIISASGYEKRSITLFQGYNFTAGKKIVFAFLEKQSEGNRQENDAFYRENGFEFVPLSGEDTCGIYKFLITLFEGISKDSISILVDYSCMTRMWYATIINLISSENLNFRYVSVYLSYTPASFSLPKKMSAVKYAESLMPGKVNKTNDKPVALIIGLGIDQEKAAFLIKKLNPAHLILMYADPAFEKKYVLTVLKNNRKLVESVEIRNLLNYPLADLEVTSEILRDLCLVLRMKFNVIIAPIGPKVFSLLSLLCAVNYPDIDVWRVSSGKDEPVYDRIPLMEPVILKVSFVSEENED